MDFFTFTTDQDLQPERAHKVLQVVERLQRAQTEVGQGLLEVREVGQVAQKGMGLQALQGVTGADLGVQKEQDQKVPTAATEAGQGVQDLEGRPVQPEVEVEVGQGAGTEVGQEVQPEVDQVVQ